MLDIKQIGHRIKELRKEKGMTQSAFAEELCVSFQAVSNWERGIAPPELENLVRIASCFGVLVDDLLRPASEKLFLGIDGGGTKTEFVVVTQDGRVLSHFVRGGSNPNDIGLQEAVTLLVDGIRAVLAEFPSVCAVFCGIAGAATGDNRRCIQKRLSEQFPTLRVEVDTDSANLLASDSEAGMAVISGTGSVVFVRRGEGTVRLGGWGYLLDEGGSAYDIGRDALRVALSEEDSCVPACLMSRLLKKKLGTERVWDALHKIYAGGKPFVASLAEAAFLAYENGDEQAVSVIRHSAARLGELLNMGVAQYGAPARAVAGGGLFEHHGDILCAEIARHTDVELVPVGLPPVYGACRRGVSLFGDGVSAEFYENFQKSYGGIG